MQKIKAIFNKFIKIKPIDPVTKIRDHNHTYFLITAYTAGTLVEEKKNHIINYIKKIRNYYPDSFIILIDSVIINEIGSLCDIYIHESKNNNIPHGQGDLDKLKIGIGILESIGAQWFIRSAYDYWLNDNIFCQSKEWIKMIKNGKKVVSSKWKWEINQDGLPKSIVNKSISTGYGCYTVEAAKVLFGFEKVSTKVIMEQQVYSLLIQNFSPNEYFLYNTCEEMFKDISFDVFNNGGHLINEKRMNATL